MEKLAVNPKFQFPASFVYSKARTFKALFQTAQIETEFPNFVFIVSCGRSGTTLLRKLLVENYSIYIPPETYVLPKVARSFMDSGPLQWPDKVAMTLGRFEYHPEFDTFNAFDMAGVYKSAMALPDRHRTLGGIVKLLFEKHAEYNGIESEWLGDKTPINTFNLGMVRKIFPNAYFLHIARDPADVIESIVRMDQHGGVEEAAMRWRNSISAWRNFQNGMPSDKTVEITYEDLVDDVSGTLGRVAKSIGLPSRPRSLSVEESLGDVGARSHHSNVLEPVRSDWIGKGRRRLSADDRRIIGPIVNDFVSAYGYERL